MSNSELKYLWERLYGNSVNPDLIEVFGEYVRANEEHERAFLWFLVRSSGEIFANEVDRGMWITNEIKKYHDQKAAQPTAAA